MKIVAFRKPSLRRAFVLAALVSGFVFSAAVQAQTGEGKDPLTERAPPRQKSKNSSTASQPRQSGVSKTVARTPARRRKAVSSRTTSRAASNRNQDETDSSVTVPQRAAPPPPNTVANGNNLRPANGYRWVDPNDPNDFRVELLPGLIKVETGLRPDKGYDWVNPDDPDDFRVELVPDAEITSVSYEHNAVRNGKYGLLINVNFKTYNLRGTDCVAVALFYFASGQKLKDFNDNFVINKDHVATFEEFEPTYDSSRYDDFKLFIPYTELHVKSDERHWLTFNLHIAVEDDDDDGLITLATSVGNKFDVCIGCK